MNAPLLDRRRFLRRSAGLAALVASGPLLALGQRLARGQAPVPIAGYGPLIDHGDLWLPAGFHHQVISWQGRVMSDGGVTPGFFDGMGAFPVPGSRQRTVLIRNHENREAGGEIRVEAGAAAEYDAQAFGGNTKLVVERRATGERDPENGRPLYEYEVVEDFAILGGTTTNCAGGELPFRRWVTCEEVVKRSANGTKHGYIFEMDADAAGPVAAQPVRAAGRFAHEAVAWRGGWLYLTEDRGISADARLGSVGACFYRYLPGARQGRSRRLAESGGTLQALKLRNEVHANMNAGRMVGVPYPVEWVTIEEPDHEDDSDDRRDRYPGFIPTRIQAQDQGAAFFSRLEGAWATGAGPLARVFFDCTSGGAAGLGQVWEFNPARQALTLLFESTSAAVLRNPDNITVVRQTGDVLLCEDAGGVQFMRGLTRRGEIYDFARTGANQTEFCGACFDRARQTLYVNQQGGRGALPAGPPGQEAVTYAIYGPFGARRQ